MGLEPPKLKIEMVGDDETLDWKHLKTIDHFQKSILQTALCFKCAFALINLT